MRYTKLSIYCWQCVEKGGESRTARGMNIAKMKMKMKIISMSDQKSIWAPKSRRFVKHNVHTRHCQIHTSNLPTPSSMPTMVSHQLHPPFPTLTHDLPDTLIPSPQTSHSFPFPFPLSFSSTVPFSLSFFPFTVSPCPCWPPGVFFSLCSLLLFLGA